MDSSEKPKRRIRYRGTHPRKFHEKYKELDPSRYPDEIEKSKVSGKTPAGSHRPICMNEILQFLNPLPGQIIVDATLGYGGHSTKILEKIVPTGRLLGFDVDPLELPRTEFRIKSAGLVGRAFSAHLKNFEAIPEVLKALKIESVDSVLADLGVSSMQLDNPDRGFSFKTKGPLDLRMNPQAKLSAANYLKTINEAKLAEILKGNADEAHAELIAKVIIKSQRQKPIATTEGLAQVVREALTTLPLRVQKELGDRPVRRVFQALRIAVNNEYGALETFLKNLPQILKSKGKVAILTFHSGEDRRVKKAFQLGHRSGLYSDIARRVILPSPDEVYSNPRASSAKLRWAIRS